MHLTEYYQIEKFKHFLLFYIKVLEMNTQRSNKQNLSTLDLPKWFIMGVGSASTIRCLKMLRNSLLY